MFRLRKLWAVAATSVASLGIGLSLLLGGALGTTAATGASPAVAPAATTGTTPAARRALMAWLTALERPPPRDMFMTDLPESPLALAVCATGFCR